jgi:hypothetical protein
MKNYKTNDFIPVRDFIEHYKNTVVETPKPSIVLAPENKTVFHDYDRTLYVDVDETLVFLNFPESRAKDAVDFSSFGFNAKVLVHKHHVELIKQFRARGIGVIVWSVGGVKWARAVVEFLGLTGYVTAILPKPSWMLDDKDPSQFLRGIRFYKDIDTGEEIKDLGEASVVLKDPGTPKT